MQTFLPYSNFNRCAKILDNKRLGKQRVEAYQIMQALKNPNYGWQHHPAVEMWRGYEDQLALYYNYILREWLHRGFRNSMSFMNWIEVGIHIPLWLGNEEFHASHRSNLLRKNPEHYSKFGWTEPNNLPYYWPTKINQ